MEHIRAKIGQSKLVFKLDDLRSIKPTQFFALDIETTGRNKQVGDCPYGGDHGVAGVSLCNSYGDACYIIVDDLRKYGGVTIRDLVSFFNQHWLDQPRVAVFHNCKFDLSFLMHRGLDVSKVKIQDTWILHSLKNTCAYRSNSLKDIARDELKIQTESESVIKNWLLAHQTEDYGDLPIELIGPYACDDVRYTLMLLAHMGQVSPEEWSAHDRIVRNALNLNQAERRGISLHTGMLTARIDEINKLLEHDRRFLREHLGSKQVNFEDPQAAMKYLHSVNLHPAPRDYYGTTQYVLDDEFVQTTGNELAIAYRYYFRRRMFLDNFSAKFGKLSGRVWMDNTQVGVHPSHKQSVHSRGGLVQLMRPNFADQVKLTPEIRELFKPRVGYKFVTVLFQDLPGLILADYIRDTKLFEACWNGKALEYLAHVSGVPERVCSLWLRREFEGSGNGLFGQRLKLAGYTALRGEYTVNDKLINSLCPVSASGTETNYRAFKNCLEAVFRQGPLLDRGGRFVQPPTDKLWRGFAILLQSSTGGIISYFMDFFCRVAKRTQSELVLAHERELIYEVPKDNQEFATTIQQVMQDTALHKIKPIPKIQVSEQPKCWTCEHQDAHDKILAELL